MDGALSGNRQRAGLVIAGFIALAVFAGPVRGFSDSAFAAAMNFQTLAGGALSGLIAGVLLLALSVVRREVALSGVQWLALLVLLLPQWFAVPLSAERVRAISWLHATGWGLGLLLSLAAPLWLALLAALEWVPIEVPRAVVGAGIAGVGAAYLVIPVNATSVAANQAPLLALQIVLSIAVVFTWVYAVPRLAGAGILMVAGAFMVLSAAGDMGLAWMFERGAWQAVDWHGVWGPLLMQAVVAAVSCWLWFWLLQRMALAAFSMHTLAVWTAAMLPGFAYAGFAEWRIDFALVIALAALVVALRARVSEEQPVALGLSDG